MKKHVIAALVLSLGLFSACEIPMPFGGAKEKEEAQAAEREVPKAVAQTPRVAPPAAKPTPAVKPGEAKLPDGLYAKFNTTKGMIVVRLFYKRVPMTVANFSGLAEGKFKTARGSGPYYDGLNFHRVIKGFMIQGGCPQGSGRGNPGYSFPDEFVSGLRHAKPGILSMANSGPHTNGSQFFITHAPTPHLDNRHTVFGEVVSGMGVVMAINKGDRINKLSILRIGAAAKAFKNDQATFSKLTQR
jgi:peptidylprolyl isomerase